MTIDQYIENTNKRYKSGSDTDHTFRGDFKPAVAVYCPVSGSISVKNMRTIICSAPIGAGDTYTYTIFYRAFVPNGTDDSFSHAIFLPKVCA